MPEIVDNASSISNDNLFSTSHILIVDDDVGFIQVLSRILKRYPDQRFATSCTEALRLVEERAPDLIFLDIEMPDHDGLDFCKALKLNSEFADIPVIFITSHANVRTAIAGFKVGGADFVTKPVSQAALLARVSEQLERKRAADSRKAGLDELLNGARNIEEE